MIIFSASTRDSEPMHLTISCQSCGSTCSALAWKQTDWLTLFHLIPVFRWRNVFVRCGSCGQDFIARCSFEDLKSANPLTLEQMLVKRVSFVAKTCAVLGLLLCWAPLIGIIPSTIAFVMTRKRPSWVANVSVVALVISAVTTMFGVVGLFLMGQNH